MSKNNAKHRLEILTCFEEFEAQGGNILSFADYYNTKYHYHGFEPFKEVLVLALCEDYARVGEYDKIFQLLQVLFSLERWTIRNFKRFMGAVSESKLLAPLQDSIFHLHENCKNYFKSD